MRVHLRMFKKMHSRMHQKNCRHNIFHLAFQFILSTVCNYAQFDAKNATFFQAIEKHKFIKINLSVRFNVKMFP